MNRTNFEFTKKCPCCSVNAYHDVYAIQTKINSFAFSAFSLPSLYMLHRLFFVRFETLFEWLLVLFLLLKIYINYRFNVLSVNVFESSTELIFRKLIILLVDIYENSVCYTKIVWRLLSLLPFFRCLWTKQCAKTNKNIPKKKLFLFVLPNNAHSLCHLYTLIHTIRNYNHIDSILLTFILPVS